MMVSVWWLRMVWVLNQYYLMIYMIKYKSIYVNIDAYKIFFMRMFAELVSLPKITYQPQWKIFTESVSSFFFFKQFFFFLSHYPGLKCLLPSYFLWMVSGQNIYTLGVDFFLLLASWVSNFRVYYWSATVSVR